MIEACSGMGLLSQEERSREVKKASQLDRHPRETMATGCKAMLSSMIDANESVYLVRGRKAVRKRNTLR